jgi:MFS family permease
MQALSDRFDYLFRSTKGLVLVGIAMVALVTAFFGMLSGPMAEFGIKEIMVRTLGLDLVEAEREGRIIMLYHAIAMAVVAIEVYFMTDILPMKKHQQSTINATVTFGYLLSMIFGLSFAYFGHNFVFHGIYLLGLSLMFFGGILLAVALWPWRKEYHVTDPAYAHTRGGTDLERVAFFTMAIATLGSALFGAVTGSYWGNGHETFLAEDLIREPSKTILQKSIIGHLHIMLTLIAIAITLIVGRWLDFKGVLHKIAMPLMILGTIIISLGAWSVVLVEWAHSIIYVGSVFVLLAALFFVIFSWDKLIREGVAKRGIKKASFWQKIKALVGDPLKFGVGWQMVFMNFTVSGVGIFMAAKLDEIFRVWPHREERITLTGHWHILSALVATIILLYYADMVGLKGKARRWYGWVIIIFSNLAFAAVTIFSMKRLFVSESAQQPLVNWTMLLADLGIAIVLVALAMFLIWRLLDLFRKDGHWKEELAEAGFDEPDGAIINLPPQTVSQEVE